jgi:cytochrome c553
MVGIAHAATPQEINAAAAWYSTQKPAPGQYANPALAIRGKALYVNGSPAKGIAACQDCHGGPTIQASAPRLAGQNSEDLLNQLRRIRARDRAHPTDMTSSTTRFDNEQIRSLVAYIASQ